MTLLQLPGTLYNNFLVNGILEPFHLLSFRKCQEMTDIIFYPGQITGCSDMNTWPTVLQDTG